MTQDTTTEDKLSDRKMYSALITFDMTTEGYVHIPAKSEEHARSIIAEMTADKKNVEIIDLFIRDVEMTPIKMEDDTTNVVSIDKEKMN